MKKHTYGIVALAVVVLCLGCTHRAVVPGDEGGLTGDMSVYDNGGQDIYTGDWFNPTAPDHIYLVDINGVLIRFSPKSKKVHKVGKMGCIALASEWAFSMSVDRFGVAWVNVRPNLLLRVNTKDASCKPTAYKAPSGYGLFGMGFAPTGPNSHTERLFIASASQTYGSTGMLAHLDLSTLSPHTIGPYPKAEMSPELTGTRNGKLYGYFPGKYNTLVAQLDQGTAKAVKTWNLPGLGHDAGAWAFAHWGGMFYLFISNTGNSRVLRLNPSTGKVITWVNDIGYRIVGAGVSSRAPGAANDLGI